MMGTCRNILIGCLLAVCLLPIAYAAFSEVKVCVRLFDTKPAPVFPRIVLSGRFRAKSSGGFHPLPSPLVVANQGNSLALKSLYNRQIADTYRFRLFATDAKGVCIDRGKPYAKRCYAGALDIAPRRDGGLAIRNTVSKREYLVSVLASETLPAWPMEALKAQAVISQTRLAHHSVEKFALGEPAVMLSDSTTDEAYFGIRKNERAARAVDQVWGEVLVHQRQPIEAFYHSTCAGKTSDDGYFSGAGKPKHIYSVGVPCHYCKASPFYKVHVVAIPIRLWKMAFPMPVFLDGPDTAGRFRRAGPQSFLSAYSVWLEIGQVFGWDKVPGTWMSMKPVGNNIELRSRGAGHGVGLCQWGAAGMAKQGFSYRDILRHYYPKAMLQMR